MASEDKVTLTLMKQAFTSSSLGDEEKERALIKLGLIDRNTKEAISEAVCTKKDIEALVAQGLLNEEQKEGILAVLGLDSANKSASVSIGLFTKGIWANIKAMLAWMVSNPFGQIMLGAGLLMGAVGIIDLLTTSVEEHREQLSGLKSEYSEIKSELDGVNSELESTQNKIKDLESKGTLTFTEAEELENLRKQNNELKRQNDLLEMQEKIKAKEVNDKFVETMEADAGKIEYASGNTKRTETRGGYTYEVNVTDITEKEHAFKQIEELSKLYAEKEKATTEEQIKAIDQRIETVNKYLQDKNKEWLEDAEGIDYIQNPTTEDDKKVNEWLDYINDFQDKMAIAMGGDNAKENAFNRLVDNWKFDEALNPLQKLGKEGKVTLEELKKRMDDPVFVEFVNKLKDIGFISDTTDGSLRFLASAFNGTTQAARSYVNQLSDLSSIKKFIGNIDEEAKALGTTKEALGDLVQEHILFNNTGLDTSGQISALQLLGSTIDGLSGKTTRLISLLKYAAGDFSASKLSPGVVYDASGKPVRDENGNPIYRTEEEIRNIHARRQGSAQSELDRMKQEWEKIQNLFNDDNNTPPPYTPSDGNKDKGKDNTPDYEDPTDAIINRINLRAKELEQQEESIQNTIEIAELENDYKKQISLTNDLIDSRKNRIDELNKANAGLHNEAEWLRNSSPWNEESWFDSQGNATEDYYKDFNSATKEQQKQIKELFEALSKYKKAYTENTEKIVDLNKQILKDEKEILDLRIEQFDKANDFANTYLDSQKTLLQAHYDIENSIAEARHEINKELETSMTMYEYLEEEARQLLFNQEDYNKLSKELNEIEDKALSLQTEYDDKLRNSTLETVESITSQYEMQYEMLMKSYEIAKADLEIAKKKQQLNNVLNERNVRMFINGQWQWVADTEDVANAKAELADAEYARRVEESGLTQQKSINNLTKRQDELGVVIKQFENGVIDLDEAIKLAKDAIGDLPNILYSMYSNAGSTSSSSSYGGSSGGSTYTSNPSKEYVSWAKSQMAANSTAWKTADASGKKALEKANQSLGSAIGSTYDSASGTWKHKHADGTRYTPGGLTLMGEEGIEAYISSNGHLIPINQPTIGNIGAGGIVFNQEQMANLRNMWDLSNLNFNHSLPNLVNRNQSVSTIDNSIHINGMTISEQGNEDWISGLKRYVYTHKGSM